MLIRGILYGMLGWCTETCWTAAYEAISGTRKDPTRPGLRVSMSRRERWLLAGHTYLWMFPIYALLAVAFEPAHDAVRGWPWPLRGLLWMVGLFVVEYGAGWLLRRLTGRCPWDYTYARTSVHGLIRLDYAPAWFLF